MPKVLPIDELESISNRIIARRLRSHQHDQSRPLISVCKDLVLYISQFREGKLTAAVAVALDAHEIGSGVYTAVRVIVSAALVGIERGYDLLILD